MRQGFTVWFTGMPGSGKTTMATLLAEKLRLQKFRVEVLDGDIVRTHLSKGLGYSREDRDENVRRDGFLCEALSRNGVVAIAAMISPFREARNGIRTRIHSFVEVHMDCPLELLIQRDAKGLYKKALAGEIPQFTGVSDPYEPPLHPELRLDSSVDTPTTALEKLLSKLVQLKLTSSDADSGPCE
jgi:adenylyl-sulfate kinase